MNDEAVNDIWETVLKVAVEEYTLEMNKEYLFDDEINHIALPTNYKLKMHKLPITYLIKLKKNNPNYYSCKLKLTWWNRFFIVFTNQTSCNNITCQFVLHCIFHFFK